MSQQRIALILMNNTKHKSNFVWNLFSSVKLTIVILILLALTSIIGTIIPQISQRESIEFARSLSPETFRFFNALNLFDMYHSLWFRSLIGCLVLNLLICSIDRFPGTWKLFRTQPNPERNKPFERIPPHQSLYVKGKIDHKAKQASRLLRGRYRKIHAKDVPGKYYFYMEKGGYSRFGVYIVHASVILILIGALVGSLSGFEAFVNIAEGDKTGTVTLRKGIKQALDLGFEVRCDKFTVEFYKTGAPKEYRSDLTFLVDGKEVEKRKLLVNHPVQFMGVTFYQSTYGTIPGKNIRLKIHSAQGTKKPSALEVEAGSPRALPNNNGRFAVVNVKPDFMGISPAVLIEVVPSHGEKKLFWVFQNYEGIRKKLPEPMLQSPKFNPSAFAPYTFYLDGLETSYYTGLQVNRDPGVPIVWTGCFLIIIGFFITFFTSHLRIWVRMVVKDQGINVSVAGTSNRNPVVLERELMRLVNALQELSGE